MPSGIYRPVQRQWAVIVIRNDAVIDFKWSTNGHPHAVTIAEQFAYTYEEQINAGICHVAMCRVFPPGLPQNVKYKSEARMRH